MLLLLYCLSAQAHRFLFVHPFLYRKGVKPYLYLCLFMPTASCPFTGHPQKSLAPSSSRPPFRCSYTLSLLLSRLSCASCLSLSSNDRCSSPFLALHSWQRITSLSLLAALSLVQSRVILSAKVHLMFNMVSTRTPDLQNSCPPRTGAPSACTGV